MFMVNLNIVILVLVICNIMVLRNQLVTAGGTNVCTPEPVGQMYFVCRRHAISRLMEGIDVVLTHSEPKQSRHMTYLFN